MSTSILDVIGHYQRSIERAQKQNNPLNESKTAKFLHCIEKLSKLPVKVEHLQATGIGKTVNSLRKYEGEVGVAAKALVAKWKAVVTAEEFAKEQAARNREHRDDDNNDGGTGSGSCNNIDPNGNVSTNSNNGYSNERETTQHYQYNSNYADKQQTTKQNSAENIYYQNQKFEDKNKHSVNYEVHATISAPIIRPSAPIDPNYVHTIDDDDDDDDNDVQLIIDENVNNHIKASPQLICNTGVEIKSDKYGNEVKEVSKHRDQKSKKDKHQKRHSSERKQEYEHQKTSSTHSPNFKLPDSNKNSNHIKSQNETMVYDYEPPSAAEVCQEDMYSDRMIYNNSISDNLVNDINTSSIQNVEHKSDKHHKTSHTESEHSSKKKKSKKHKEKKSKSKHHDNNDDFNRQSDSKHGKKHKDKDKLSKDKSSKHKKSKDIGVKEFSKLDEETENEKLIQISNEDTFNDPNPPHFVDYNAEVTSTTMTPNKIKKSKNETLNDNGIDSTTGASFEQALGMMEMPNKKAKYQNKSQNETSIVSNYQEPTTISKKRLSRDEPSGSGIVSKKQKVSTSQSVSNSDSESSTEMENFKSATPLLLSSSANLKPLDPSIALELPTISNNYKPMPLNPTVMDCVFPQSKPQRLFTDEEALAHGISSKTIRTKVYSGAKIGQKVQIPTLFNLCIRCLQKNIDALEYTGGVPFDILRPVLERATPEQLSQFEEFNPYLMHDTDVLWEQHVKRRFRSYKREEMESFREMYIRCKELQDAHLNRLTENIKQSQIQTNIPLRKTQLAYVDSLVKPPRYVKKKQEKFGTNTKLVATPAARVAALQAITPNATKSGDVRLRVAAGTRDNAQVTSAPKARKAPLMAKTLQFMKGRIRR
ncbi:transcription elongation factor B polypeptide 3 [Condylostylus longicornis]|uniref:transcription elongation factor B polypeptide 3 n=1 Tax=Condylostylus longicornis TaxID=2530218 RepID=UPI00244D9EA9|nr:transcription elongation factor B polypeptide 3 [Condylostylus longicornis]